MLPRWPVSNREVLSVIESYRGCNSLRQGCDTSVVDCLLFIQLMQYRPVDYWVQRLSGPFAPVHLGTLLSTRFPSDILLIAHTVSPLFLPSDLQRTNFCGLEVRTCAGTGGARGYAFPPLRCSLQGSLDSLSKLGSLQALNISKTGISDDAFIRCPRFDIVAHVSCCSPLRLASPAACAAA